MHSRAIVILSLFALACIIVAGSIAIRFTLVSASGGTPSMADAAPIDPAQPDVPARSSSDFALREANSANSNQSTDGVPVELSAQEIASADTLEMLLRRVHGMFDPQGSEVINGMIPYLAEVITVVNQYEDVTYRVEILDRDVGLAQSRARTLSDVLRLNVLDPSRLQIAGRGGSRAIRVDASGS